MDIHHLLQLNAKLLWNLKSKLFYAVFLFTENPEKTIWYTPMLLYLRSFCICFLCPVYKVFHLLLDPMLCSITNEAFLWMESIWTSSSLGSRICLGCLDCVQIYILRAVSEALSQTPLLLQAVKSRKQLPVAKLLETLKWPAMWINS